MDWSGGMKPCNGKSRHICLECKLPYACYMCPDILNPSYSEGCCWSCLQDLLGRTPKENEVSQ